MKHVLYFHMIIQIYSLLSASFISFSMLRDAATVATKATKTTA